MKITAEPRSDQWNADDFIGGPMTFTISGVKVGSAEQKYDIELVEGGGRFWRPPLTMLRLLIKAWGDDATVWIGRRVTLFRDEKVRFGSDAVGGIRISHMSDLPGNAKLTAMLTSTRGRRAQHTVEPLPDGPRLIPADQVAAFEDRIAAASTAAELKVIGQDLKAWELGAFKEQLQSAWRDRSAVIKAGPPTGEPPPPVPAAADAPVMVTEDQLADLAQLLDAEGFDDEPTRLSFVGGAVNRKVAGLSELTAAEAETVIGVLNDAADGAK